MEDDDLSKEASSSKMVRIVSPRCEETQSSTNLSVMKAKNNRGRSVGSQREAATTSTTKGRTSEGTNSKNDFDSHSVITIRISS